MNKITLISQYLLLIAIVTSCKTQNIELHEGDLLFKQQITDNFSSAIVDATTSIAEYRFTHVGVACQEHGEWFVLEAVSSGVCKTAIDSFLTQKSIVVVGRLVDKYQAIIPNAISKIKQQIGKPYDNYFSASNDAYYCSELIQQNYLQNDTALFTPIKMTFKNLKTGKFPTYWVKHFKALRTPIPEGEDGSNPGQMSQSEKIKIIGKL